MKLIDFDKLTLSKRYPNKYLIKYRSNWHGARIKEVISDSLYKEKDYIFDYIVDKRYSYRNLISIEEIK